MSATTAPPAATHGKATAVFTCILAALAGLMFGLDIGVISGAQQFLQKDFGISDDMLSVIVGIMMVGAALGALVAGWLSSQLGRKRTLILGAVLFVAGSVLCGLAWTPHVLIVGRLVLGLAIGLASFTAPLYLAEIAPESIRGAMISLYQLMITIGILVAFLSDTAFSYSGNWRWMLGVIAIPGALFLLGVAFLPESPRWLMMKNRQPEAEEVLHKLLGNRDAIAREIGEIREQLKTPQRGVHMFFQNANFRRSVGLGVLFAYNVLQSRAGRAIRSLRGGAILLASVGADAFRVRLTLFVLAALLAGVAGWLYAHTNRFVSPSPFDVRASIEYLLMAVAGGLGQLSGALVGAALVLVMKNALQDVLPMFTQRGGEL